MPVIGLALVAQTIQVLAESASSELVKLHRPRFADGTYYQAGKWDNKPEYAIDGIKGSNAGDRFAHSVEKGATFTVFVKDRLTLNDLSHVIIYPRCTGHVHKYQNIEVTAVVQSRSVKLTPETTFDCHYVRAHIEDGMRWNFSEEDRLTNADILDEPVILILAKNERRFHLMFSEIEVYRK